MEDVELVPISVAGLVNFGNTSRVNVLLQALASCPRFMQYADTLAQTLATSRRSLPIAERDHFYGDHRWQADGPLLRALSDTLQSLQPQADSENLRGTASALPVLHALVAHKVNVFEEEDSQQDLCKALENILLALQKEVRSWLNLQSRPYSVATKVHCRIPSLLDSRNWNPILDVPIFKNTPQGPNTIAADDMGHLQIHLNNSQGPCNGLLAESVTCQFCSHAYPTKFTNFTTLKLSIPTISDSDGRLTTKPGLKLEECIDVYCSENEVGPIICPRCSLLSTLDSVNKRWDIDSVCGDDSHTQSVLRNGCSNRVRNWLGWRPPIEHRKPAKNEIIDCGRLTPEQSEISHTAMSVCSGLSSTTRGLVDLLDGEYDAIDGLSAPTVVFADSCSSENSSSYSFDSTSQNHGLRQQSWLNLNPNEVARNMYRISGAVRSATPNSGWSGSGRYLDAISPRNSSVESIQTPSSGGVYYRTRSSFNLEHFQRECRKPVGTGKRLKSEVTHKIRESLNGNTWLHSEAISAFKRELEGVDIPWLEEMSTAKARTTVGRLPVLLPIYLPRQKFTETGFEKIHGRLEIPMVLDMSDFTYLPSSKGATYHLAAVVIHIHDESGGYYLTARRIWGSYNERVWFMASDETIQQISEADVRYLNPCFVMYEREKDA